MLITLSPISKKLGGACLLLDRVSAASATRFITFS
jgi:hypothetical protein